MQKAKRSVIFSAMMAVFMLVIVGAIVVTVALFTSAQQGAASVPQTTPTAAFEWHSAPAIVVSADAMRNRQGPTLAPGETPANMRGVGDDPEAWRTPGGS